MLGSYYMFRAHLWTGLSVCSGCRPWSVDTCLKGSCCPQKCGSTASRMYTRCFQITVLQTWPHLLRSQPPFRSSHACPTSSQGFMERNKATFQQQWDLGSCLEPPHSTECALLLLKSQRERWSLVSFIMKTVSSEIESF